MDALVGGRSPLACRSCRLRWSVDGLAVRAPATAGRETLRIVSVSKGGCETGRALNGGSCLRRALGVGPRFTGESFELLRYRRGLLRWLRGIPDGLPAFGGFGSFRSHVGNSPVSASATACLVSSGIARMPGTGLWSSHDSYCATPWVHRQVSRLDLLILLRFL